MTTERDEKADVINKDKIKLRIINRYPNEDLKNRKDVEKKLFEIFKKYEDEKYEND